MRKKELGDVVENGVVSGGADSSIEGTGLVMDLEHTLNRLKVWMVLGRSNPEVANFLLNRDRVEEAAAILSAKDGAEKQKKEALKALGLHELAEQDVTERKMSMADVIGVTRERPGERKKQFEEIWQVEINGEKKSVEDWLTVLKTTPDVKKEDVAKLKGAIEQVKDKFGVERLKFISLDSDALSQIEDGVATLKAKNEYFISIEQRENSGGKSAVAVNFGREIANEDGLLKVRDGSRAPSQLGDVVKRVREGAVATQELDELEKLSEAELLTRFRDVNHLLVHIGALRGSELSYIETKRLKHILINLQTQYQEQLANKFADQWQRENKHDAWQEVKYQAMEKALNKRRSWFSAKVDLKEADDNKNLEKLRDDVTNQARLEAERLEKAKYRTGQQRAYPEATGVSDANGRALVKEAQLNDELDQILRGSHYNMFDDKDFWTDLQSGEEGIKRIVERAGDQGVVNKAQFEKLLHSFRKKAEGMGKRARYGMPGGGEMDDTPEIISDLHKYMAAGEWGAAANAMLAYTTRVGMQENTNDLQFMYVRRNFMEKITKVSPDFAEQFQRNQQMGYLPGVFSQKPEDFYGVQGKVFAKGNTDLFFGPNAFMSGNVVEMSDGKKMVISTKSFLAALRSERNILRILRADPNTMDSTLQNILLEEIYGEGTKLGVEDVNGKDEMIVNFADGSKKFMKDIKIKMSFANVDLRGYKGWKEPWPEEFDLEEMLNTNQWILRNSVNFMWYSEMWMDTMKSYQPSIMANAPKALLTAASAIADYKASFENVAPPFLDVVQKIGDMLGPMERYKAADMMGMSVANSLTEELIGTDGDEMARKGKRERYEKVGKLFEKIFVRKTKAMLNGTEVDLNNRVRSREMTRYAFNNFAENSGETIGIVKKRLIDLGLFPGDIPSDSELLAMYQDWKAASSAGIGEAQNEAWNRMFEATGLDAKLRSEWIGKRTYMGQEYAAVWEELSELKMSPGDRDLWNSLSASEFGVLSQINSEVTGGFGVELTKDNFFRHFDIEAFLDRTGTKHGDDWEQFAMKYAPAKIEALKLVYKIAGLNGTAEDYDKLKQQLDLFMKPEEKRTILLTLMDRQSIATRGEWLAPYEVADIERNEHGDHQNRSSFEIKWVKYTDSTGKTFFARTADGTRAYHKTKFRGNYARKVLDKDWWRPHDFEVLLEKWRADGLLDKHTAHHMAEKLLGTKRSVDSIVDGAAKGLGIDPKNLKGFKEFLTKGSTTLKLWAIKLFLFDDPKYALWTLFEEFMGFGGKSFEHITGVAMGGGKHH